MDELFQWFQQIKETKWSGILPELLYFLLWSAFILFLVWLIRKAIDRTLSDNTMRYRARKAVSLGGYVLIFLLTIMTFTGKLQYFSLTIGLISAGIAFAMQEVIMSVAGWISIFSSNMYKPGDRIEINGVKGDVIDISITKTTLMEIGAWTNSDNYSGRIVRISNAFVFKGPVFNYSTDFPFVWDEINLPVKYGSDTELAGRIILDAATKTLGDYPDQAKKHWKKMVQKYLIENAVVEPTISMKLTDNWIEFNLRYVVSYQKRRSTKTQLFAYILEAVTETKGKVTLASATFEVLGLPLIHTSPKK